MRSNSNKTTFFFTSKQRSLQYLPVVLVIATTTMSPCIGEEAEHKSTEPKSMLKAVMLDLQESPASDLDMFNTIRAQLSALPVALERIVVDSELVVLSEMQERAHRLASEHNASIVFWIESSEKYRVMFYISGPDGEYITQRTLDLNTNSQLSRFEAIAIAVTSMAEGVLSGRYLESQEIEPVLQAQKQQSPKTTFDVDVSVPQSRQKRMEFRLSYTGQFFAKELFIHGVGLEAGIYPIKALSIAASFSQYAPFESETQQFRLKIVSRNIGISAAGVIRKAHTCIRLGIAWHAELRSFSPSSYTNTFEAAPKGMSSVYYFTPFISTVWFFSERFGLFGLVGAAVAVNETDYQLEDLDQTIELV